MRIPKVLSMLSILALACAYAWDSDMATTLGYYSIMGYRESTMLELYKQRLRENKLRLRTAALASTVIGIISSGLVAIAVGIGKWQQVQLREMGWDDVAAGPGVGIVLFLWMLLYILCGGTMTINK